MTGMVACSTCAEKKPCLFGKLQNGVLCQRCAASYVMNRLHQEMIDRRCAMELSNVQVVPVDTNASSLASSTGHVLNDLSETSGPSSSSSTGHFLNDLSDREFGDLKTWIEHAVENMEFKCQNTNCFVICTINFVEGEHWSAKYTDSELHLEMLTPCGYVCKQICVEMSRKRLDPSFLYHAYVFLKSR